MNSFIYEVAYVNNNIIISFLFSIRFDRYPVYYKDFIQIECGGHARTS